MATAQKSKNMTVTINVKTDKKTKEEAQRIAAELGFSLSGVINASLKQLVRTGEVFVSLSPVSMSKFLAWEKDRKEMEGKKTKGYSDAGKLLKDAMK